MELKLVYRILRKISEWALGGFYSEVVVKGGSDVPPDGPLIFSPSHHNEILDIATLSATAPHRRIISYWAKSSLFRNPVVAHILRSSGAIPVDRSSRDNQALYAGTFAALATRGHGLCAVGIFPEGTSYTEPRIVQVKEGLAWSVLEYVKWVYTRREAGEDVQAEGDVLVVPVGIVYTDKSRFRSRVYIRYGKPFSTAAYAEQFLSPTSEASSEDEDALTTARVAVKRLTADVARAMVQLTVNAPDWESLFAARMARDILWGGEKNVPLHEFALVSQSFIDLFADLDPSTSLTTLKTSLLHYHALLYHTSLTHASLSPFPFTASLSAHNCLGCLFLELLSILHPRHVLFLPAFAIHVPSYILASLANRYVGDPAEEEARAQFKVVVGGLGVGIGYGLGAGAIWKVLGRVSAGGAVRWQWVIQRAGRVGKWLCGTWGQKVCENIVMAVRDGARIGGGAAGKTAIVLAAVWLVGRLHGRLIDANYALYNRIRALVRVLAGTLAPTSGVCTPEQLRPYLSTPRPAPNPFIGKPKTMPRTTDALAADISSLPEIVIGADDSQLDLLQSRPRAAPSWATDPVSVPPRPPPQLGLVSESRPQVVAAYRLVPHLLRARAEAVRATGAFFRALEDVRIGNGDVRFSVGKDSDRRHYGELTSAFVRFLRELGAKIDSLP